MGPWADKIVHSDKLNTCVLLLKLNVRELLYKFFLLLELFKRMCYRSPQLCANKEMSQNARRLDELNKGRDTSVHYVEYMITAVTNFLPT